jgi:Mg2+-importing ATPase
VLVAAVALGFPYVELGAYFGFVPLPAPLVASLVGVTLAYVAVTEALKRRLP